MKAFCVLGFLLVLCTYAVAAPAPTPVKLEVCTVTPTIGGVSGCPNASAVFAAVSPTSLVRALVNGGQGWHQYSTLPPDAQVVPNTDYGWHTLSSLTVAMVPPAPPVVPVQPTPPIPPPTPPPPTPIPTCAPVPDQWVPLTWSCTPANGVMTCTAPLK